MVLDDDSEVEEGEQMMEDGDLCIPSSPKQAYPSKG